ncbi:hypothetical protein [Nannocystis pusilla]|uniref:hypothetical protein n=1 Tax=Nannocystis pusilla TaxID=889268 RepID=UPI003DA20F86
MARGHARAHGRGPIRYHEAGFASRCPQEPFHVDPQTSPETAFAAGGYALYLNGALDSTEALRVTFEPE